MSWSKRKVKTGHKHCGCVGPSRKRERQKAKALHKKAVKSKRVAKELAEAREYWSGL